MARLKLHVKFLLCFFVLGQLTPEILCMHEDQAGKFDWHQKFVGPINFIANDPNQPKRILLGARNNIIGAVHGNTGNILYRQILEESGELLYFGVYQEKQTLAISYQQESSLVKLRFFGITNGILLDERAETVPGLTHATEANGKIFLVGASSINMPTVSVSTLDGSKPLSTNKYRLGITPKSNALCDVTGQYLVCSHGKLVSILNLQDGTIRNTPVGQEVLTISTSGTGDISAVNLGYSKSSETFIILENAKAGPELLQVKIASEPGLILSQARTLERPLLFVSKLESPHSIKLEVFTRNGEKVEPQPITIKSDAPIMTLAIAKGYYYNSGYGFIGFTKDSTLVSTKADSSVASGETSIEWTRQESLASVVAVEMVDYPSEAGPTWNPYQASLDVVTAFVSRVKYEIETIITGESLYSSAEDRFGLRKVIVFLTRAGKVVGMDSTSGSIIYSFVLPDFSTFADGSAQLYIQRPAKYTPLKPQAAVVYRSSTSKGAVLFAFDPVEGKPLDEPKSFPEIQQTQMLLQATEETKFIKPILLLDNSGNVHAYPSQVGDVADSYFFVARKETPPKLEGYDIKLINDKLKARLLWNLNLGQSELVGVYGKLPTERVHSQGRVLPDRSVSYKYMNPNLAVVVTSEQEQGNINLYLIDAVSGAVLHSFWHKKCRGPVHVVHSEHWIVYSLFNEKNRRYEINSVELYEGKKQSNASAFSSFAAPPVQPIVVKQSFIYPAIIQYMAHTRTEKGITNKDILMALPSGGIMELPRIILQPRLSQQHYTQQYTDDDGVVHSIPYVPELPMPADMIINYNQSIKRVDGIKTWPTRLESTCLVLVYGNDLFYTKTTPSKTFDVLKDDFDHWFITVVLAGLVGGAYLCKRLAARKQLDHSWR